jgi:hypothetical protein
MRTNADSLGVLIGPVCKRAERNDLGRMIAHLADDKNGQVVAYGQGRRWAVAAQPHPPPGQGSVFNGVAILKQFFKIIVCRLDRQQRCPALVVAQEGLLETIDWPEVTGAAKPQDLTDGEAARCRVPLSTVTTLAVLDFGALAMAAQQPTLTEVTDELVAIEGLSELTREIAVADAVRPIRRRI